MPVSLGVDQISDGYKGKRAKLNQQVVGDQTVQHSDSGNRVRTLDCLPMVQRLKSAGHMRGTLGDVHPGLLRLRARLAQ